MSGIIQFKFRSAISYDTVLFDGHFITVGEVKRLIAEKKGLGKDTSAELVLSDPRSGEEYKDDSIQLPRNTSVLVRRCPPQKHKVLHSAAPITRQAVPVAEPVADQPSVAINAAAAEDEFGGDPFSAQAALQAQYAKEWEAIDNVVATSEKDWRRDMQKSGRGRGRGRGAGRGIPPPSYMCYRCGQSGHYINDCPTNDDPSFDVKRVRQPVGIPVNKLSRDTEGGLLLPGGDVGCLLPNENIFLREVEGLPTSVNAAASSKSMVKVESMAEVKVTADSGPSNQVEPKFVSKQLVMAETEAKSFPVSVFPRSKDEIVRPSEFASLPPAVDEFDFHRANESLPAEKLLGDVDDALLYHKRSAAPLSLGMDIDVEPEINPPRSDFARIPPSGPTGVGSSNAGPGFTVEPFELSEHLLFFQDLLPRGNVPLLDIHRAFFRTKPMTPAEFGLLQQQARAKAYGSREQPRHRESRADSRPRTSQPSHSLQLRTTSGETPKRFDASHRDHSRNRCPEHYSTMRNKSSARPVDSPSVEPERKAKRSRTGYPAGHEATGSESESNLSAPLERAARPHRQRSGGLDKGYQYSNESAELTRQCGHSQEHSNGETRCKERHRRQEKRDQSHSEHHSNKNSSPVVAEVIQDGSEHRCSKHGAGSYYGEEDMNQDEHSGRVIRQARRLERACGDRKQHATDADDISKEDKKKKKHKKSKKHKSKCKNEVAGMSPTNSCPDNRGDWEGGNEGQDVKSRKWVPREDEMRSRYSSHYDEDEDEDEEDDYAHKPRRGGRKIEWKPQPAPDPSLARNQPRNQPKPEALFNRAIAEVAGGGLRGLHKSVFCEQHLSKSQDWKEDSEGYGDDAYDEDVFADASNGGRGNAEGHAADPYGDSSIVKASKRARLSVRD